jgi:hypothetical protein
MKYFIPSNKGAYMSFEITDVDKIPVNNFIAFIDVQTGMPSGHFMSEDVRIETGLTRNEYMSIAIHYDELFDLYPEVGEAFGTYKGYFLNTGDMVPGGETPRDNYKKHLTLQEKMLKRKKALDKS